MASLSAPEILKSEDDSLVQISIVKGLFNPNRPRRSMGLVHGSGTIGYPSCSIAKAIAEELYKLRTAIRDSDELACNSALTRLSRMPTRRCLSVFLGLNKITDEDNAGWIYILSTRDHKDLLKIGVTTRTVEARAQEINNATGVAVPFGVRRCWRVLEPRRAEKLVHQALYKYRLRNDREFFRMEFQLQRRWLIKPSGKLT